MINYGCAGSWGGRPLDVEEGYSNEPCLPLQNNPASPLKQDEKASGLNGSARNLFILISKVSVSLMVHTHKIQLSWGIGNCFVGTGFHTMHVESLILCCHGLS